MPVLVVWLDQPNRELPNRPMQWVISEATTAKKSPLPEAGLPACVSPLKALTMLPANSELSKGVGSRNQPWSWLVPAALLPRSMLIEPLMGLPPRLEPRLADAPNPPPAFID